MALTLFNWLDQISYEKKPWSSFSIDDYGSFNPYLINRFISMKSENIEIVNLIQKYPNIPKKQLYNFYCNVIPKKKTFFKYIKSSKQNYNIELIELISKWFNTSIRETIDYYSLLDKDEVMKILLTMNKSNKQIKNLMK